MTKDGVSSGKVTGSCLRSSVVGMQGEEGQVPLRAGPLFQLEPPGLFIGSAAGLADLGISSGPWLGQCGISWGYFQR